MTYDSWGRPAFFRDYLVFEADKDRALALVRMDLSVNAGEIVEALGPVTLSELRRQRMKPGGVQLLI
jgi:hypothetical protein